MNHEDCIVSQTASLYRECFASDIPRLENLI